MEHGLYIDWDIEDILGDLPRLTAQEVAEIMREGNAYLIGLTVKEKSVRLKLVDWNELVKNIPNTISPQDWVNGKTLKGNQT